MANDNNSENGRSRLDSLNLHNSGDVVDSECPLTSLHIGNILDAQDYLGSWHLSIVIDGDSYGDKDKKTLHFLPFSKANRDEVFSVED